MATQDTNKVFRTIGGVRIGFDKHTGGNSGVSSIAAFTEIEDSLPRIASGLTGGTHGTAQPYSDYSIGGGEIVRKCGRGIDGQKPYLELVEYSLEDQQAR